MKFYVLTYFDGSLCKHGEFTDIVAAWKWARKESGDKHFELKEYENEEEYYKTLD